jgi:hypothetical protein
LRRADLVLGGMGAAVVLSWVAIALVHIHDRFELTHVGGARMALAQYAAHHAAIYPPLAGGGFFGGTRFMPLPIVLHALVSHVTGEFLVSGKVLSYAAMAVLLTLVYVGLRRVRCPRGLAMALAAMVLLTQAGFELGTGVYADAVPVALQLGSIIVLRSTYRRRILASGVLCALALFSKQSALWAPAASAIWLLLKDRRACVRFMATFAGSAAVLLGVFAVATHGRIGSVLALTFSGELGNGISRSLTALGWFAVGAIPLAFVVPLTAFAFVRAVGRREPTLYQLGFVFALAILVVILSDVGTSWNHSVDVVVLASLVTGELVGSEVGSETGSWVRAATAITVALALVVSFALVMAAPASNAVRSLGGGTTPRALAVPPLRRFVRPGDSMLSQDPSIPVLFGQRPVIEDPFMLLRVGRDHPQWLRPLIRSIRSRTFDEIVLMESIRTAPRWYFSEWEMGTPVIRAVAHAYRLQAHAEGYYIYVPRR